MTILVPITLYGWVIAAISLFALLPPRRAALTAYIVAWLFLPQAGIPLPGMPDLDKVTASGMGVLLGVLMFDAGRLMTLRFSWVDLPMVAWCISSVISAVTNGLGLYDGLSGVLRDIFTWGIPYFVGRLYFNDLQSLRELAIGIFIGGLVYVPLCLIEIRLSPQLHRILYGFHPAHFAMAIRFGGYRPMVFMQHGLAVGMWMTSATLVGAWLWMSGALTRVRSLPMWLLVGALAVTTVLCKSMGALALLGLGISFLLTARIVRVNILLALIMFIAPVYMIARIEGWWNGAELVNIATSIDEERAQSLQDRLNEEDLLMARASERPLWGWGGWGRWRIKDEWTGEDLTSSDGMWVIVRGERGNFGLIANTLLVLLPFALFVVRVPAREWARPAFAAPAALAVLLLMWSIDNLFNAMHNPIYIIAAGGLVGLYLAYPRLIARQRAMQQQFAMMVMAQQQAYMQEQQRLAGPAGGSR